MFHAVTRLIHSFIHSLMSGELAFVTFWVNSVVTRFAPYDEAQAQEVLDRMQRLHFWIGDTLTLLRLYETMRPFAGSSKAFDNTVAWLLNKRVGDVTTKERALEILPSLFKLYEHRAFATDLVDCLLTTSTKDELERLQAYVPGDWYQMKAKLVQMASAAEWTECHTVLQEFLGKNNVDVPVDLLPKSVTTAYAAIVLPLLKSVTNPSADWNSLLLSYFNPLELTLGLQAPAIKAYLSACVNEQALRNKQQRLHELVFRVRDRWSVDISTLDPFVHYSQVSYDLQELREVWKQQQHGTLPKAVIHREIASLQRILDKLATKAARESLDQVFPKGI